MDFFWVAHAGIGSQPKWKKKQLHLRKHTHTHKDRATFFNMAASWLEPVLGQPYTAQTKATQAVQLHYVQLNDFHSTLLSAAPHTPTLAHQDTQIETYVTLSFACHSGKRKKVLATESIVKTCNTSDQVAYREQQTENRNRPKRHFQLALPLSDNLQASLLAHKTFEKPSRGTLPVQPCFTMSFRDEAFV